MENKIELTREELYKIELAFELISTEIQTIKSRTLVQDCSNTICLIAEYSELLRKRVHEKLEGRYETKTQEETA